MAININSEAYCRKAYLNYHCYGNSMNISAEDMGKITEAWKGRISSWQASVSNDENEYEFDDSEYSNFKVEGRNAAKETTGHDGGKDTAHGVIDVATSAGNAIVSSGLLNGALTGVQRTVHTAMSKGMTKIVGEKAANEGAKKAVSKGAMSKGSWIVGAPLALAIGAKYMASKPNKDEKEACDALQSEMLGAQATLSETQEEMAMMGEEIITLSDEALYLNEEANENIEEQKTEYDMYYETLMAIQAKVDSGEPLTDSEKELYKEVVGYLQEIGVTIGETSDETSEGVTELYDEMATYQEGYDVAAETMGEIEGLTDFAESFDSATQTLCYIEAGAQTLNAASGGKAAFDAGKFAASGGIFTAWAWAFSAMGASGAAMSGVGATQQFSWAGEVGTEIEMRKGTQDLNADTLDIYTEEIDAYDGWMQGVEDLELEIPDDIAPPEDVELPTEEEKTGADAVPDELKPKKEDEEGKNK